MCSTAALHEAEASPDRLLLLLAQRDPERDEAGEEDVFSIGTIARVVQVTPLPDGTCRVVLEGMGRGTVERFLPYWHDVIAPALRGGRRPIVAAHGNSLRALVKYLDGISDEEIPKLNIPTGVPMVYEFEDDLTLCLQF